MKVGRRGIWRTNGVEYYTAGQATVTVSFPENQVQCIQCRMFCEYSAAFRTYRCRLTGHALLDPFTGIDMDCPLDFGKIADDNNREEFV